jgi:hypothetical protein
MLPTHNRQVQDSTGSQGRNGSGMAYPPKRSQVETRNGTNTSLQTKICGPRGVTSFTIQTQTPSKSQAEIDSPRTNGEASKSANKPAPNRSRWNTPEFYLYAAVFLFAVPYMCWVPVQLSQGMIPTFYYN